ncbi:MAG: hypothetical protein M1821_005732 [Bathelium mastoideum]|nr:MAG: hypothetical protein M1821_005732 [Bathelium mastoideum]
MEKYSEESEGRLLGQGSECSDDGVGFSMPLHKRRRPFLSWLGRNALTLIASVLLLYNAVVSTVNFTNTCAWKHDEISVEREYPLLPDAHIEFEDRLEWADAHHPWNLPPGDALDNAWDDLLYGLNVRISTEEMALINQTTTNRARVSGGGYAGAMGIWHELHCINNLRKLNHWEYYGPKYGGKENKEAFGKGHTDHCLDMIRQSLMCRPDTDLYPFSWGEDGVPSAHVHSLTPKQCVKWDSLDTWASKRALRPGQFSYIREHHDDHHHDNH